MNQELFRAVDQEYRRVLIALGKKDIRGNVATQVADLEMAVTFGRRIAEQFLKIRN